MAEVEHYVMGDACICRIGQNLTGELSSGQERSTLPGSSVIPCSETYMQCEFAGLGYSLAIATFVIS